MRAKIDGILKSHLRSYWGIMPASDELTALMCYQEAKAFIAALNKDIWLPEVCEYLGARGYSGDTIWAAVQEIKNEKK